MKIGVVVLNWHQADDVITCVRSVMGWSLLVAVWVVDNASTDDGVVHIRQACPAVQVIVNEANLGFAGGNNVGMQAAIAAGCEAVMLLNNDALVDETAVSLLTTALNQHPELGMVGPSLWELDNPEHLLSAGGDDIGLHVSTHLHHVPAVGELAEAAYVPGTCILIKTEVLNKIGLLDETYFFSGEVADLCARARQHGYRCAIIGGAKAFHEIGRSAHERRHLHAYYILRNRFLFVRKFHAAHKWRLFVYWTWQCGRAWGSAVLTREWPRARAVMLACWDGWNGRFGSQNQRVTKGAGQ